MIFLAGSLGLFGVVFGFSIMAIHLASLRSFGIPYLAPIAPIVSSDQKDVFVRLPWWKLDTRPEFTGKRDVRRQARGLKPHPPEPRRKQAPSSQRKKRSR
jgi:spore germination protein KA